LLLESLQQFGLLGGELCFGDGAAVAQRAESLEGVERITTGRSWSGWYR
jgi:hypothetical protein